jgi:hypothetical protein
MEARSWRASRTSVGRALPVISQGRIRMQRAQRKQCLATTPDSATQRYRRRPLDGMPSRVGSVGSRVANGARRWDGFPTGRWLVPARLTPQSRATAAYPVGRPGAGRSFTDPRLSDKPATTAVPLCSRWMRSIPGRGRATSVDHLATSFAASTPTVQHAVHTPATSSAGRSADG